MQEGFHASWIFGSTDHARCLLATLRGVLPKGVFHCFWAGLGVMFR